MPPRGVDVRKAPRGVVARAPEDRVEPARARVLAHEKGVEAARDAADEAVPAALEQPLVGRERRAHGRNLGRAVVRAVRARAALARAPQLLHLDDDDARAHDAQRLEQPVVDAVDVDREHVNVPGPAGGLRDKVIDVFDGDKRGRPPHAAVDARGGGRVRAEKVARAAHVARVAVEEERVEPEIEHEVGDVVLPADAARNLERAPRAGAEHREQVEQDAVLAVLREALELDVPEALRRVRQRHGRARARLRLGRQREGGLRERLQPRRAQRGAVARACVRCAQCVWPGLAVLRGACAAEGLQLLNRDARAIEAGSRCMRASG